MNFIFYDKNMCVISQGFYSHIPFYFIFLKRLWHCFTKIFIYFILNIPKKHPLTWSLLMSESFHLFIHEFEFYLAPHWHFLNNSSLSDDTAWLMVRHRQQNSIFPRTSLYTVQNISRWTDRNISDGVIHFDSENFC